MYELFERKRKNMPELVSVIVPVYNVEKYLARCIDSILAQAYENLQVILVNDGSPDGSPAICEGYAKRDGRIEIINKENGGLSDARNAGILRAKGAYIAFVDSDDYIHRQYIGNMYERMKRDGSDICACDCHFVNEGEEDLSAAARGPELADPRLDGLYPAETAMKVIHKTHLLVAWNKLYRRGLFGDIMFPAGRLHEDEFVLHRLLFACESVSILSERLYFYLQRDSGIMGQSFSVRRLDALDAFADRAEFYLERGSYELLRLTCLHYIQWYMKSYSMLPMQKKENRARWKECRAKFRSHNKVMLKYGGLATYIKFCMAAAGPGLYRRLSKFAHNKKGK